MLETSRKTRNIRKARSTENAPVAGINATDTMRKSKIRQGSRQKPRKSAIIRAAISATNMPRMSLVGEHQNLNRTWSHPPRDSFPARA